MSAMSASSGLMPLSLISEHKSAQGGSAAVQPLAFPPEKLPIVQPVKPTPNGMESSPPLVPVIPTQQDAHPPLSCGGVVESGSIEDKNGSGGNVFPQSDLLEAAPFVPVSVAEQPPVTELAPTHVPVADTPSSNVLPTPSVPQPVAPQVSSLPPASDNQALPSPQSQPASNTPLPDPAPPEQSQVKSVTQLDVVPNTCESHSATTAELPPSTTPEKQESKAEKVTSEPQSEGDKAEKKNERPAADPSPEPVPASTPVPTAAPPVSQPAKAETSQPTPAPPSTTQSGRPSKRAVKNTNIGASKKNTSVNSLPAANAPSSEADGSDDQRTKRKRLPTQVYQSPLPELNIIAKMSKTEKPVDKAPEDKLIVFYRNEFLAVRNEEGGYYVCQTMQNVYKSSSRIRIRWLSQQENTDYYSPDFYDNTEFDCILTNLNLERIEKNKYRLPDVESQRTQSILKRAIDVQKGIAPPEETTVTEEHPDGLDLSLYRNEEQLKKRKRSVRNKVAKKKGRSAKQINTVKKNRDISKRKPVLEIKKTNSTIHPPKRLGRGGGGKPEKSVVQLIVEAKKMGRRKAASSPVANKTTSVVPATKEVAKKKEPSRPPPPKRKINEPQSAPVPEKKSKPGTASKTRNL